VSAIFIGEIMRFVEDNQVRANVLSAAE